MNINRYTIFFFILGVVLFFSGCIGTDSIDVKSTVPTTEPTHTQIKTETRTPETVKAESTSSADTQRYYYNIRIIPPSALESLQNELGPDEYLIRNENEVPIGVVSPRSLYIRGDLVLLQKGTGREGRQFDKTDIAQHLVDIAFGFDNAKLGLFKSDRDYQFWFDAYYTQDDISYVMELTKFLNSVSDTTQFEDEEVALGFLKSNYVTIPYNYYNIKMIPENMLDDFKDKRKPDEHLIKDQNSKLIGIVGPDRLYLLETLPFEQRKYFIQKGILYSMGLHGTTFTEQESFFYKEEGKNLNMSELDIESIKLLYGGRLKSGMDLEETRQTLGLSS